MLFLLSAFFIVYVKLSQHILDHQDTLWYTTGTALAVNYGHVSLLSHCRNLAVAERSGGIWQHRCQPMPRIRCETSAVARGDAAALLLTGKRWRHPEKKWDNLKLCVI